MQTLQVRTLGCSKNTVDTEHLLYQLREHYALVPEEEERPVDILLINTCGFIGDAKQQSIDVILSAAERKKAGEIGRLLVFGCLSQRYPSELPGLIPEVDGWFGARSQDGLLKALGVQPLPTNAHKRVMTLPGRPYAYLKISEGCDRRCSYCAIPLIRGAHKSRPIEELVQEAKMLVAGGVKELIVISQDTTFYGLDLYHKRALGELLNRLATESGAPWIRLHYTYPASFPDDAIDAIARHPNLCNYIDIPLQHINSRILNSMQRGIDREGTLRLLERFRAKLPDVAIRTTLIVGYPGETEAEFEELKHFVAEARFDRMGCFAYSPEEGTPAYRLGDPVPDEEKQRRVSELMALQESISLEKNRQRIGKTYRCIVDRREGEYIVARTEYDSPEVDDEVLVRQTRAGIRPGDFINVRITDALENDLLGEQA